MALDFPNSPTVGQTYNGYIYDGTKWKASPTSVAPSVVSATPPTNPTVGDMWFNSTDGTMYFYYNDGNTSQWVESRAPIVAIGYYSPNYVINGGMDIWQRGTSFSNPSDTAYNADRWRVVHDGTGATRTVSQQAFTAGTAPVAGYEGAYFLRYSVSNAGSGNTYQDLNHTIEDVRTLAGQTVTLSFWAKADATRSLNLLWRREWNNYAGADQNSMGPALSLTTSWARYSVTYTVPSLSGITAGTNSNVRLVFRFAAATTQTVDIWGVQLEAGAAATTFRRNANSIQGELAACQRYYFRKTADSTYGIFGAGNCMSTGVGFEIRFPVNMRIVPSAVETTGTMANYLGNSYTSSNQGVNSITLDTTLMSTTSAALIAALVSPTADKPFRITAANTVSAYLGFSAEL